MVSCCLSATGISLLGHPSPAEEIQPSSRSACRTTGPDLDGVSAFRTYEMRPGWAPSVPRGRRCSPRTGATSRPAPAASQRPSPCTPTHFPSTGISLNEASTKGSHVFARPVFPSLWPPGWNGPPLGQNPGLRTPPTKSRTTHARAGTRPSSTDLELHAQLTLVDLQSGSSLEMCDLASHVALR
jgi:hypothetical protein